MHLVQADISEMSLGMPRQLLHMSATVTFYYQLLVLTKSLRSIL
jgi:hypothetical protein